MKIHHVLYTFFIFLGIGCAGYHAPDDRINEYPAISPDYADVTFPCNIAPPNFKVCEEGEAFQVEIGCEKSVEAIIQGDGAVIRIPESKWKALMEKAAGKNVFFRVSVKRGDKWICFQDIVNTVSPHPIDPFLVYRLLYPGYELWNEMGIYQRDLTSYKQTPVAVNRDFEGQCVNCHSFSRNNPETMMLHIRGKNGGTIIHRSGETSKIKSKPEGFKNGATYPAWHPSGRYIAYSLNEIQQFFHSAGKKPIEVADLEADIAVYDTETNQMIVDSLLYTDEYMETFPTWSPDGKTLYFCRSRAYKKNLPLDSLRYDLFKVQFDEKEEKMHALECVYKASSEGKSVSFPRVSPDGKYVMFTRMNYGNFSIWHPESDLFLLNLQTGELRCMDEVNSDDVDSYHAWSSSGRWFVFSSKRMDGLWARPYFASFNPETGALGKPFLLPQRDPDFYDSFTYTYNVPELIKAPIQHADQLLQAIGERGKTVTGR